MLKEDCKRFLERRDAVKLYKVTIEGIIQRGDKMVHKRKAYIVAARDIYTAQAKARSDENMNSDFDFCEIVKTEIYKGVTK